MIWVVFAFNTQVKYGIAVSRTIRIIPDGRHDARCPVVCRVRFRDRRHNQSARNYDGTAGTIAVLS